MNIHQIQQLFGKPLNVYVQEQQKRSQTYFLVQLAIYAFAVYGIYKAAEEVKRTLSER